MTDSTSDPEGETLHQVDHENNVFANSTIVPNIVDDMDLSPYAFRLYLRFNRRVCQNRDGSTTGSAYDSTQTLAQTCNMSTGQVSKAKQELVDAGLIKIKKIKSKHGEWPKDHVTIVDIWGKNRAFYSKAGLALEITAGDHAGELMVGKDARALLRDDLNGRSLRRKLIPDFIRQANNRRSKN